MVNPGHFKTQINVILGYFVSHYLYFTEGKIWLMISRGATVHKSHGSVQYDTVVSQFCRQFKSIDVELPLIEKWK